MENNVLVNQPQPVQETKQPQQEALQVVVAQEEKRGNNLFLGCLLGLLVLVVIGLGTVVMFKKPSAPKGTIATTNAVTSASPTPQAVPTQTTQIELTGMQQQIVQMNSDLSSSQSDLKDIDAEINKL